ncbi:O-antigen ligase-like membrane protein [Arcticibacter pallidicorallinus]|uniref:O-antigen ligase-like membrane protein n=2 Tax=Arcticibacter pallidicorallinus TaxID=1259464 RepID=A0A2T0UBJ5_9SPHI|nr:O-antigen ligase-like membrane protein [Arcticibacter pallidicorallinus]
MTDELLGQFGNGIRLEVPFLFFLLFSVIGYYRLPLKAFSFKSNPWFYLFVGLCFVSFFNPINPFPVSALVPLSFVTQMLLLLKVIERNFTRDQIYRGIFDGLTITITIQFFLAICYPVLGIEALASFFKGEAAMHWAERREGYRSAVGIFTHPGHLALYCLISVVFFLANYLNHYEKKLSTAVIGMSLFVLFLTYSRTTYIVLMAVVILLWVIFRQGKGVFTFKNILIFAIGFSFLLFVFYLSPLSEMYLKSDSEEQFDNRFIHGLLGYEIWRQSKLIGIGVNSHVYYLAHKLVSDPFGGKVTMDFFTSNPIHNIHVIIAAEVGILGLLTWLSYVISKVHRLSKLCSTSNSYINIINMTFVGVLTSLFLYGFFGWSPFDTSIFGTAIFIGYFATTNTNDEKGIEVY